MKTIIATLVFAVSTFVLSAQTEIKTETNGTTVTVTVPVPSNKGTVYAVLHSENTFMKDGGVEVNSDVKDAIATITFENVTPGTYAVLLFLDTNGNKKMDFEPNGMPAEMYGASNNVMSFGPPMWSDAKFEVANEPVAIEIRL
ncbi:DUF2141 domain-containing protein [Jejudonia soesokkakensis]|uniref:DUF2141 domain-containing protein n=1 Tax=Jejudonia soesokkakensis TaxID=1323432 RepID=A0ABW2MRT3_9FLAO